MWSSNSAEAGRWVGQLDGDRDVSGNLVLCRGTNSLQGNATREGDLPHPLLIACMSTAFGSGILQFLLLLLRFFRRRFGELLGWLHG